VLLAEIGGRGGGCFEEPNHREKIPKGGGKNVSSGIEFVQQEEEHLPPPQEKEKSLCGEKKFVWHRKRKQFFEEKKAC